MRKDRLLVLLAAFLWLLPLLWSSAAQAQARSYVNRPLTLEGGQGRIDLGPPDYGFMDHGALNDGRGFRFGEVFDGRGRWSYFGAGGAYGITPQFELGGLLLPLHLSGDGHFGDMEVYGRYAFSRGGALGLQFTVQLPTDDTLGVGIGLPAHVRLGGSGRLETGIELEIMEYGLNVDVPAAFMFGVGNIVALGPRTGLLFVDIADDRRDAIALNLGFALVITPAPVVDLSFSFNWPWFFTSRGPDDMYVDVWELVFGVNIYLGG
ncbi:MAG: hypothetical protein OEZ06_28375 [Myxococcales bacterium]|nr:hypothetical protein [Myxococcales bacterium]